MRKKLVSLGLTAILVVSTSVIASAIIISDDNGKGQANFGATENGIYKMSYCYYHHDDASHFAIAYLDGHNNGKVTAYAGKTASSNSPTRIGGRDTRDWGKY